LSIIAFFGLGTMGAPMAENLLKAGYKLCSALTPPPCLADKLAAAYGLEILPSFAAAAGKSDVIITMLPNDAVVKSFLTEPDFVASVRPGTIITEMSSTTGATVQEVEAFYKSRGVQIVDAPVSGGVVGAERGTLTIFGSGEKEAMEKVKPVLEKMGTKVYRLGSCGTGKNFKNINNLLLAVHTVAASEVFHLAKEQRLDLNLLYDVVCDSSGGSTAFKTRFKRMIEANDLDNGFKLVLGRKDLGNALALAKKVPMPVAHLVYDLMLANAKNDNLDIAGMCKLFE
jgi:3-hydroxyisobutyrate dehydrogenase